MSSENFNIKTESDYDYGLRTKTFRIFDPISIQYQYIKNRLTESNEIWYESIYCIDE